MVRLKVYSRVIVHRVRLRHSIPATEERKIRVNLKDH